MPPAALISILQKGLQYVEAEISINEVTWALLPGVGEAVGSRTWALQHAPTLVSLGALRRP